MSQLRRSCLGVVGKECRIYGETQRLHRQRLCPMLADAALSASASFHIFILVRP